MAENKTQTVPNEDKTQTVPNEETELVHLERYGTNHEDLFVCVNGKAYIVKRGVDVRVPAAVAEVIRHSRDEMENALARQDAKQQECVDASRAQGLSV